MAASTAADTGSSSSTAATVSVEWKAAWAAWDAIEQECEGSAERQSSRPSTGKTAHDDVSAAPERPRKARRTSSKGFLHAAASATAMQAPASGGGDDGHVQQEGDKPVAKCLSMHQPWASLLVAGIKTVEGRSWPTRYRGPLWIASTAKKCAVAATDCARAEYAMRSRGTDFPAAFPSAVLLGRVTVTDCLESDEWRRRVQCGEMSDEANDSPFLFVCDNPHRLTTPLPVRGMHRIWTLPADIAASAAPDLTVSQQHSQRHATDAQNNDARERRANAKRDAAADPGRAKVRNAFAKALSMGDIAAATPPSRSILRAAEVESALFAAHNHVASDIYKERARVLLFNLRDALNAPLRGNVLGGRLTARKFVAMGPDELANPKLQAANKALDAALLAELNLSNSGGCETEGMFMCPDCQCQKTHHFVDYKVQGRKSEVWGTGQGADEDATTMSRVRATSEVDCYRQHPGICCDHALLHCSPNRSSSSRDDHAPAALTNSAWVKCISAGSLQQLQA